ncbi:MAG TPA: HD domain-containing protein [Candidatus Cloacimonetes bacterium]|nr:HD domain-containing protein [Candidatus Cloacimonadota bacterium]
MKYQFSYNKQVNNTLNTVVKLVAELAEEQLAHITQLTRIGQALSSETDLNKIFDMILDEGISFTKADAATIYRVSDDNKFLEFEIVYNATMKMRQGGSGGPVGWPSVPLFDEEGEPKLNHIVTSVYHTGKALSFDDVYEAEGFDVSGTIATDKRTNYRCKSMLTIPLKDHEETVLGVIQFINAMNGESEIVSFNDEHIAMLTSLASQAAIALSNRNLIDSLENLLMEFMRSIATAIERKSKYSSAHITRVAELTDIIAAKINDCESGPLSEVFFSEVELKELSMAGWMHDIGKIITPEFVMDKSTKLERIIDGIELVKERFDKLITLFKYLKLKLSEEEYKDFTIKTFAREDIEDVTRFLSGERDFLVKLNAGGEFVPDELIERMVALADIDFEYEEQRFFILDEVDRKNFHIRRGTLNPEELEVMRAHVSVTWDMLSELTFPKKYQNVAFYAATHHETLNGKGYPKGLDESQLPIQSRIIAIADIFEALTSADRPYKTPKTLSESLTIMGFMVKDGHLDKDLLDFFLDAGIHLEFARMHMDEQYIDDVDIDAIKSKYRSG